MKNEFVLRVLYVLGIPEEIIDNFEAYELLEQKVISFMGWYESDVIHQRLFDMSESKLQARSDYDKRRERWLMSLGKTKQEAYETRITQDFEKMNEEEYSHFIQYLTDKPSRLEEKGERATRTFCYSDGKLVIDESRTIIKGAPIEDKNIISMEKDGIILITKYDCFHEFYDVNGELVPEVKIIRKVAVDKLGVILRGEETRYSGGKITDKFRLNLQNGKYEKLQGEAKIVKFETPNPTDRND